MTTKANDGMSITDERRAEMIEMLKRRLTARNAFEAAAFSLSDHEARDILAMLKEGDATDIATLTAERDEQLRLNQIGQEREARLMAERDEMRASEVRVKAEIARLEITNVILQEIIVELNDQHTGQ